MKVNPFICFYSPLISSFLPYFETFEEDLEQNSVVVLR